MSLMCVSSKFPSAALNLEPLQRGIGMHFSSFLNLHIVLSLQTLGGWGNLASFLVSVTWNWVLVQQRKTLKCFHLGLNEWKSRPCCAGPGGRDGDPHKSMSPPRMRHWSDSRMDWPTLFLLHECKGVIAFSYQVTLRTKFPSLFALHNNINWLTWYHLRSKWVVKPCSWNSHTSVRHQREECQFYPLFPLPGHSI